MKIRASQLPGYNDCARRTAASLFRKELEDMGYEFRKRSPGIAPVVGTAVHAGVSHIMEEKLSTGFLGRLNDMKEVGVESLKEKVKDGVTWDDTSPNRNHAEQQVKKLSKTYYNRVAPHVNPIMVEQETKGKVKGIVTTGHPDIVTTTEVLDLKTGRKGTTYAEQLGLYSLQLKKAGVKVKHLIVDHLPRTQKGKTQACNQYNYPVHHCEVKAYYTVERIINDYNKFKETSNPQYFADNHQSVLCSPKYCHAWGTGWCLEVVV
jgi:hypothetical protein